MKYADIKLGRTETGNKYQWVCIPATQKDSDEIIGKVSDTFTEAPEYYIFDLKNEVFNTIKASQFAELFRQNNVLEESGISYIITKKVSPMAHKILNDNNIQLLKAESSDIFENIELLKKNMLQLIDPKDSMANSKCTSGGCSSCNSKSCKN